MEAVESVNPDVVVLTEYQEGAAGEKLRTGLSDAGLKFQSESRTPVKTNGVLIVTRTPHTLRPPGNWSELRFLQVEAQGIRIIGVYLPPGEAKIAPWDKLVQEAERLQSQRSILLGDFNTGRHYVDETGATFIGTEYIARLERLGFVDAWRTCNPDGREFTWYSQARNGFRLDFAYLSSEFARRLIVARHVHETRLTGVTDHSGLIVDVDTT